MTTIAYDGKTVAADKQSTACNMKRRVTKLFRVGGAVVGITGSLDLGMEMVDWLRNGSEPSSFPAAQRTSEFVHVLLVNPDGRAFHFEQSPFPVTVESVPYAIGSGMAYAMAAMRLGASAEQAVAVASEFDIYTGMGIDTVALADLVPQQA